MMDWISKHLSTFDAVRNNKERTGFWTWVVNHTHYIRTPGAAKDAAMYQSHVVKRIPYP